LPLFWQIYLPFLWVPFAFVEFCRCLLNLYNIVYRCSVDDVVDGDVAAPFLTLRLLLRFAVAALPFH